MEQRDVIVVGAGNAGQAAASALRAAGKTVLLAEERDVGGTCPLRGCVPKKVLVATAEALDVVARAGALGIDLDPPRIAWARVMERKRAVLAGTSESMEAGLRASGVEVAHGSARFVAPDAVQIGDRTVQAGHIVLATGSTPRPLALPGAELLLTSEDVLELPAPPDSAVFLGGGPISFEFAHVLARVGCRCTILEPAPWITAPTSSVCSAPAWR
ncbi:MAG: NAD(P)/FAD-dependent oxidoreductase [Myxococcales bacterium]|nr:MAG: NAD(P)/FAD-dependent oxidoreductase [Myxococcales bacterium]